MNFAHNSDDNWDQIAALLPSNRDDLARNHAAFLRPREIKSSDTLLRLALLYAWADLSLPETAAAANEAHLASLSDVALLKRFRKLPAWLEALLQQRLQQRVPPPVPARLPYRLQIVDASTLCVPGSQGTDYRLHAQYSLLTQTLEALPLTDACGGESFLNYRVQEGDLFIADRGYGHRKGLAHGVASGGQALVRFAWNHLPFQTPDGAPFDLIAALGSLPEGAYGDWAVQIGADPSAEIGADPSAEIGADPSAEIGADPSAEIGADPSAEIGAVRGRVVAFPRTPEATHKAQQLARQTAKRKQRELQTQTLLCCGYSFVFTTLPAAQADAALVLALYRFRWQVELAFKLLKSQLHLDHVRAHDPDLVRTYVLCKLLGALLLQDLTSCWVSFSP